MYANVTDTSKNTLYINDLIFLLLLSIKDLIPAFVLLANTIAFFFHLDENNKPSIPPETIEYATLFADTLNFFKFLCIILYTIAPCKTSVAAPTNAPATALTTRTGTCPLGST